MSGFRKAERRQVKLKLGIAGASGSGKTFSALKIIKGMMEAAGKGGRIALIDSENRSASLYADMKGMPEFDTLALDPPYTVDKYIAAIEEAIKEKYDFLIVDSVSHVWSGEGGLLQEKEAMDSRGGNSYTNWAKMTPKWNRFVSAILHSDIHMLCTMRSKQDYVLEANDKGKQAPKKVGMAPQVREGFEFELTAVFDMDAAHQATASKDRTSLFDQRIWQPNEKTGAEIYAWLQTGKAAEPAAPAPAPVVVNPKTDVRMNAITAVLSEVNWPRGSVGEYMQAAYATAKISELTESQFAGLIYIIQHQTSSQAKAGLLAANKLKGTITPDPDPFREGKQEWEIEAERMAALAQQKTPS
jgi:ABC-type dipeptide/oligopeptide/nickel transport system ATPase subunit